MNAEDALRFVAHEAAHCRDRDASEALCLLLPALLRVLSLDAMDSFEALDFRLALRGALNFLAAGSSAKTSSRSKSFDAGSCESANREETF